MSQHWSAERSSSPEAAELIQLSFCWHLCLRLLLSFRSQHMDLFRALPLRARRPPSALLICAQDLTTQPSSSTSCEQLLASLLLLSLLCTLLLELIFCSSSRPSRAFDSIRSSFSLARIQASQLMLCERPERASFVGSQALACLDCSS